MTDAPKRIWATAYTMGIRTTTVFHVGTNKEIPTFRDEYIRVDLHADLIKAADRLSEAVALAEELYEDLDNHGDCAKAVVMIGKVLSPAWIAYQQAREKL